MGLPSVLVVDDIASFRLIVRDMLEELGFSDIHEAADGGEALEAMRKNPVALVISDYMMSPRSGIDLLRGMKDDPALARIPFLMVTAVNEQEVIRTAKSLGAHECLIKPLSFETLRKHVVAIFAATMT